MKAVIVLSPQRTPSPQELIEHSRCPTRLFDRLHLVGMDVKIAPVAMAQLDHHLTARVIGSAGALGDVDSRRELTALGPDEQYAQIANGLKTDLLHLASRSSVTTATPSRSSRGARSLRLPTFMPTVEVTR